MQAFRRGAASSRSNCRSVSQLRYISNQPFIRLQPSSALSRTRRTLDTRYPLFCSPRSGGRIVCILSRASSSQAQSNPPVSESEGRVTKFRELTNHGQVCQTIVDTLTRDMGMDDMTDVQSLTINETLKGVDTVAQARTGTGKTLAFLIPIVQNIISHDPNLEKRSRHDLSRRQSGDIRALIISPTRELAEQIATEARKLTKNTNILVQTAVGGTHKREGLQRIQTGCHILVGTPGRLKDILSDHYSRVEAPNLSILVLDEADRLLEAGFEEEIREIQQHLPDKRQVDRQTLLFSATISREILPVVRATMKKDFKLVRTVQEGEQPTHERVSQRVVNVRHLENQMPALIELCLREIQASTAERPFKAIIFFPTLNEVSFAAESMSRFRPSRNTEASDVGFPLTTGVYELHSRLSQAQRTQAADAFRRAESAILLSSDVAARGMDFPGVTHVIQIGLPPNEEQYIHRIGRTARAGKEGEAWLILSDAQNREVRHRLRQMPLKADKSLEASTLNLRSATADIQSDIPQSLTSIISKFKECVARVPQEIREGVYVGTFGLHQFMSNKRDLVAAANARAVHGLGLAEPPSIFQNTALKFGVLGLPGVQISEAPRRRPYENDDPRSRQGFSRGSRFDNSYSGRDQRDTRGRSSFQTEDRGRRTPRYDRSGSAGYDGHSFQQRREPRRLPF